MARRLSQDWKWYLLLDTKKTVTVILETTVQHVARDDMLDAETAAQIENFNTYINELPDNTIFRIQHGEVEFNLKNELYNDPTAE